GSSPCGCGVPNGACVAWPSRSRSCCMRGADAPRPDGVQGKAERLPRREGFAIDCKRERRNRLQIHISLPLCFTVRALHSDAHSLLLGYSQVFGIDPRKWQEVELGITSAIPQRLG